MTEISKLSPLAISEEAQKKLLFVKLNKKIPKEQRLRVRNRVNVALGALGFDMQFDGEYEEGDGLYQIGPIEVVLDNATAYSLIGSELGVGDDGDFKFTHREGDSGWDPDEEIVYN